MKEAFGGVSIFQIVVLFILLFTAIMCLTINNANAFQVKDDIAGLIEMEQGDFLDHNNRANLNPEIVNAIAETSYRTTGVCDDDYIGFARDGKRVDAGKQAAVCIKCVNVTNNVGDYLKSVFGEGNVAAQSLNVSGYYYQIVVFYQLQLPVVSQVYDFKTKGETLMMYNNSDFCQQTRSASVGE